jgi:hypothetical protein
VVLRVTILFWDNFDISYMQSWRPAQIGQTNIQQLTLLYPLAHVVSFDQRCSLNPRGLGGSIVGYNPYYRRGLELVECNLR